MSAPTIGLALSGGGSRAVAFHLGCMRALHDCGILEKVSVLSAVSGGSVIAAQYAYSDDTFEAFERRVEAMLERGMVWGIAQQTFFSPELLKIIAAIFVAGAAAVLGRLVQLLSLVLGLVGVKAQAFPATVSRILDFMPRFASRTTAFERHLSRAYFGNQLMNAATRNEVKVVISATELRTESAFRFGSAESGCWRYGRLVEAPQLATAVAASAAFPALLPAIDRRMEFEKSGVRKVHRAIITDGGVYDNFGITCMLPGRSSEFSTNAYPVEFIVACDAGAGLPTGARRPYFWPARMAATITTMHRRTQSLMQDLLHRMANRGEIKGFLLPYLGMQDDRIPAAPFDLVTRAETFAYPTDFSPMTPADIAKLRKRGEQVTRALIEAYPPNI